MADPRSRPFEPAETFDEPVPYITEKGLQEVQAIHWDNWLTTDQWWTFEGMGDWETENRYYRLRFPWLADDLVDGILADYQEKGWPIMAWQIPGLDETWVSTRDDYGYWFLVVRLGDQVWSISTGTTEPTIDLAERYAAVLMKFPVDQRRGERRMGAENRHGQSSYRKSCPISIYDVAAVGDLAGGPGPQGEPRLLHGQPGGPVAGRTVGVPLPAPAPQRWKEALDPERVEAYRSMGWRLVGQLGPFWVWRCDDPNAPELDTDPVVQGEGYRYLKRRMIFRTVGAG